MIATQDTSSGGSMMDQYIKHPLHKKHVYLKGSRVEKIEDISFYIHDERLRVIAYKGEDQNVMNTIFPNAQAIQKAIDDFMVKHEQSKPKVLPNHTLTVGTVLVSNTNINEVSLNSVEFYQVVSLVGTSRVRVRLLNQETFAYANYHTCIPRVGDMQGDEFEKMVLSNSIDIAGNRIARKLEFKELELVPGIKLKVYEPQKFGLNI